MNEIGFQISIGQGQKATNYCEKQHALFASLSTQKSITLIECVSEEAYAIKPMLVLAGKVLMEDWFMRLSLDNNYLIRTSDTKYSNNQLSMKWIEYFY